MEPALRYADACRIVEHYFRLLGDEDTVADRRGLEDETRFYVPHGHRRWVEDGDPTYIMVGQPTIFVDKRTGEIELAGEYLPGTPHAERIDQMHPVRR